MGDKTYIYIVTIYETTPDRIGYSKTKGFFDVTEAAKFAVESGSNISVVEVS